MLKLTVDLILMIYYNSLNANVRYCYQENSNKSNDHYHDIVYIKRTNREAGTPLVSQTDTRANMTRFEVTSS